MVMKLLITVLVIFLAGLLMIVFAIFYNNLPLTSPPGFRERLKIYLTTNIAETSPDALLPELQIRIYPDDGEALYNASIRAVESLGWEIASQDMDQGKIHALVTTPLWSFLDDVAIRILQGNGTHYAVYLRSSSRKGRGDLGTNSRHIMDFYRALERHLQ